MEIVDVTESLLPSFQAFSLQFNYPFAKATPESALPIPSDAMMLALLPDVFIILDPVFLAKVPLELLSSVEDTGTLTNVARFGVLMASPCLNLVMLCIFMSLPIVLAAKFLRTTGKCAAIRARVPFLMLPGGSVSYTGCLKRLRPSS